MLNKPVAPLAPVKSRLSRPIRGFSSGKNSYFKSISLIFVLFILNSSFLITNCFCQWVQVSNGMGNQIVYSLAYSGNNIFAGTDSNGVYLSTNNGTNWTQTSLNNREVDAIAVNGNNIFAGTYYNFGVYLSTNNGTNWTQTSLNNRSVFSLAVNGNTIFAGTNNSHGVYISTDNGISWNQTSLNNRNIYALAINGNYIFAGTFDFPINFYGVYLSINNGTNWTQTSLNNRGIYALAVNGNNIFAGIGYPYYGVYLSTNNGTSWTQTSLSNQYVNSLAIDGNNIFAGGSGVYVSNNNGTNWIQRNEGLGNAVVEALCILNNYIFAGTRGYSVYRRPLSELVSIQPISNEVPQSFSLSQNYPNPFNPSTKIKFDIPAPLNPPKGGTLTRIVIYDILGHEAATLVNEQLKPGSYEIKFDASGYSSGIYFYKIESGSFTETKKMILIK
jgi:hypothetical protein